MSLGQRIKEHRLQLGKSQQELAVLLGITRATLASWEIERRKPGYDMLRNLAAVFNCSIDVLIQGDTTPVESLADPDLLIMFYDIKELPLEDREVIRNMISLLKTKEDALVNKKTTTRRTRKNID